MQIEDKITLRDRVRKERKDLKGKINKLFRFLSSEHSVCCGQFELLTIQLTVMKTYRDILDLRVRNLTKSIDQVQNKGGNTCKLKIK